jgi:hypothetical protein
MSMIGSGCRNSLQGTGTTLKLMARTWDPSASSANREVNASSRLAMALESSAVVPNSVGSGRLGPDPDSALINDHIITFLVCVCISHKTLRNPWCLTFWFINITVPYFEEHLFAKKISRRNLVENSFRSGSRSGCFQMSNPVKNRLDPQP